MINLDKINGNEIIDFINKSYEDNDDLDDCSLGFPLTFESQRIFNDRYELRFMSRYNNWGSNGTLQPISDNIIAIDEEGNIIIELEEPFEDDESSDILEDILSKWLPTHVFSDQSENFNNIMIDAREKINKISINDINLMNNIIKQLTNARTMMK
jgi:hypothetical protein